MERYAYCVESRCTDRNREEEFNRWYDEIHIPDILNGCPEIVACRRYKLISDEQESDTYVAFYEIETGDIEQTMKLLRKTRERIDAEGRMSELIVVTSRKLYKLDREL